MSKSVMKWIARVAFYAVALGLFTYAASRSLDFIQMTMPADNKLVGYLGLLATSGGALAWLAVFLYHASGTGQKGLALLMVVIDLLGEFALFTFDTLYRSGESGLVATLNADEVRMMVIALSALIALNIAATFFFHLIDPETSKRMREESARDTLDDEVLKAIEQRAPQLANQMVPGIIAQWEADFMTRFTDMNALGLGSLPTAQNSIIDANGNDITPQTTRRGAPSWLLNMRRKFSHNGNGNGNGRTYEQKIPASIPQEPTAQRAETAKGAPIPHPTKQESDAIPPQLYARKTAGGGRYIVDKWGHAAHRDGALAYYPQPCDPDEFPEYQEGMAEQPAPFLDRPEFMS